MNNDAQVLARKKVTQIFKYLQALDQLRNPVKKSIHDQLWTMWFRDLPEHQDVVCPFLQFADNEIFDEEIGEETYLTVRRPQLTACPEPPLELTDWLQPGWQKVENEPEIIESKEIADREEEITVFFQDDVTRVQLFAEWEEERSLWKEYELPARKAMKIFERLYSLYAWMERDSEQVELILGDGILDWKMLKGQSISHPVLLQKVRLTFDPDIPEFKLIPVEQPIEFYGALFRDVQEVSASSINKCTEDLEQEPCIPLGRFKTDDYLRRVASHLSAKGEFYPFGSEVKVSPTGESNLIIKRNPVLFLRKRSLGFASAIDRILNNLETTEVLPEAVTRITGIDLGEKNIVDDKRPLVLDVNGDNEDILFTKDANSEQLDIALKVSKYGSVLVQGPPGTGKTHTIANLIGHFLSEGKNVLVTSHTSKALHVLREKVAAPLRDMCVSVVDEEGGQNQMDQSIDAISERLNSLNEMIYAEEIHVLKNRRKFLLDCIREINRDLKRLRENEYTPIVLLGEEFQPSEAARLVRDNRSVISLIPGDIATSRGSKRVYRTATETSDRIGIQYF